MRKPDSKFQYIQQSPTDIGLLVPPIFGKVGGTKVGGTKMFCTPHLKIRGAAPDSHDCVGRTSSSSSSRVVTLRTCYGAL